MLDVFGIKLHAYGLLIGIGVYVAWEVAQRFGSVKKEVLDKLVPGLIIFGIIGARMYHVIDLWEYYSVHFREIFYIWNGGLGIWGALLGGIFYLSFFAYLKKLNLLNLLDSVVIGVPFAQAIGRLGNWVNGELVGKNGEPLFAWEAGLNILLGMILLYFSGFRIKSGMTKERDGLLRLGILPPQADKRNDEKAGFVSGVYLIGYGVIRVLLENFRPDNIIWRVGGVPVATIFGIVAIFFGLILVIPGLTRNLYK